MAQEELIDTLVSNEQLGIGKKTSIFKLIAVCLIVLVVGYLAFSFFMKAKSEPVQPPLALGQSITPAAEPIKAAEVTPAPVQVIPAPVAQGELPVAPSTQNTVIGNAQAGTIQTSLPATQQPAVSATQQPAVSAMQSPAVQATPVQPTATQVSPATQVTGQVVNPSTQPVNIAAMQQPQAPNTQTTLVSTEQVISEKALGALESKPVVKKPVVRKKPVVKVQKTSIAEETHAPAIPMEEGVTREEIIVIQ